MSLGSAVMVAMGESTVIPWVALGLLLVGAGLAFVAFRGLARAWPQPTATDGAPLYWLAVAIAANALGLVLAQWLVIDGSDAAEFAAGPWSLPQQLLVMVGGSLGGGVCALLWARGQSNRLGLTGASPSNSSQALCGACLAWLLCLPGLFGMGLLWRWLLQLLHGAPAQPQEWAARFEAAQGWPLIVAAFLAIFVAPLLEELTFRGLLQSVLIPRIGPKWGIGLTAAVFAALHDTPSFLPVFALAALLGVIMWRTQSIWACVAVHSLHNALQIGLLASSLLGA